MDLSPQTNYHRVHCEALTHLISPQCGVTRGQTNEGSPMFLNYRGGHFLLVTIVMCSGWAISNENTDKAEC